MIMPDPEPESYLITIQHFFTIPSEAIALYALYILGVFILLSLSAMFSSAEIAFFSLGPNEIEQLKNDTSKKAKTVLKLLNQPNKKEASKRLLATILLSNNFANIALVIVSSAGIDLMMKGHDVGVLYTFLIKVVLVTFLLVLFGEIVPKIYATKHNLTMAKSVAHVLHKIQINTRFFNNLLVKSTSLIENRWEKKNMEVSVDDLNKAIDITSENRNKEEQSILKGLINLSSISVTEIMKSRIEICGVDKAISFESLMDKVKEWNYSRIPVYEENLDHVVGLIYVKDLIPLLSQPLSKQEKWNQLIRDPFFVPESKKIDDLMQNFQEKKIHLALVVDEYGGTSGLVTMEDILEEIFGEIKDEFDDDEWIFSQLDDNTFVFEGKIMLNDVIKIVNLETNCFEAVEGDFDTLGGLVMELTKSIPKKGEQVEYKNLIFTIEKASHRRIDRIKLKIVR